MRLLAFALAIIATFVSFGINHVDSANVIFRAGHRQFDPSLGENRREMDNFLDKVREAIANGDIEYIMVRAYASPDGISTANELLARHRCDAISDFIVEKTGISNSLIRKIPEGIAWDGLKLLVEETPEVPSREAVLNILNNTPIWIYNAEGKVIDGRKKQLMSLNRGIPYRWMQVHLFPKLRNAVALTMMTSEPADSVPHPKVNEIIMEENGSQEKETITPLEPQYDSSDSSEEVKQVKYSISRQRFALKTNLLYYAILMPNLELEWLVNKNWSVSLEGNVAWWKPSENKVYRLAIISPEARYHIKPRGPWHGMYVGAFVGGGLYQLENGGDGYRGEGGMGGLSFGYMWPLGNHFFMEAAIGAGYMHSVYKVYEPRDGHRLYMRTKSLNYFGPLKLKLSIAWRFNIIKKSKKINSPL